MTRALVTGGHGFVASHLAKALLERGEEVRVLDRPAPREADVGGPRRSALECSASRPRWSCSRPTCATPTRWPPPSRGATRSSTWRRRRSSASPAPRRWRRSRSTCAGPGTSSKRAARTRTGTVVFASSDKAYGASPELPYREDFPLRAAYPYDASKAAADIVARSYAHAYGLPIAVTRFANIYGGGDLNFSRLIPETAIAVIDGRAPVIRSDGSPERDFLHVDDAVSAYLAIAAALGGDGGAAGEAFNAGGERPHSVREVVETIAEIGQASVPTRLPRRGQSRRRDRPPVRRLLEAARADRLAPAGRARDGLARTLEWYREHPEARP